MGLQDGKILRQKVDDCVNGFFLIFRYLFLLVVYTWLEYLQSQRVKINSVVGLFPSASISSETDLWQGAVCDLFSLYSISSLATAERQSEFWVPWRHWKGSWTYLSYLKVYMTGKCQWLRSTWVLTKCKIVVLFFCFFFVFTILPAPVALDLTWGTRLLMRLWQKEC